MTTNDRVTRLERMVEPGGQPPAVVVLYDPAEVLQDADGRTRYFQERRPQAGGVFLPDNGRDEVEP